MSPCGGTEDTVGWLAGGSDSPPTHLTPRQRLPTYRKRDYKMSVLDDSKDLAATPVAASFRIEQGTASCGSSAHNPTAVQQDAWHFKGLIDSAVNRYLCHPYEIPAGQGDYILRALTDLLHAYRVEATAGRVRPPRIATQ